MPSYLLSRRAWASRAAELRMSCVFASGLNGSPFSMPIDLSMSIISLSRCSQGSVCTMRSSDWKKRKSYGIVES